MRKFVASFVLGMAIACFSSTAYAQGDWVKVVVDFEEYADALNADAVKNGSTSGWAWNGTTDRFYSGLFPSGMLTETGKDMYLPTYWLTLPENTFESKGLTFNYGGWDGQAMNFWCGTGLSTVTDTVFYGYMNEMTTVAGSGNNGSQTYAVSYGDCGNDLYGDLYGYAIPWISLPTGAILDSIAITNTTYTAEGLGVGLDGSGGYSLPSPPVSGPGEAFGINIYGVANGNVIGMVRVELAGWRDDEAFVLMDWATFDLSSLTGSEELWISFYSTIEGDNSPWGLWNPVYFAYDDLTYSYWDPNATVPDSATLDLDGDGVVNDRDATLLLYYAFGNHVNNPDWAKTLLRFSGGNRNTGDKVLDYLNQNLSLFDLDDDGVVDDRDATLLLHYAFGNHVNNPDWAKTLLRFSNGSRNTSAKVLAHIERHLP